jgi:hypothetical protein
MAEPRNQDLFEPPWLERAWVGIRRELLGTARALVLVMFRPRTFALGWSSGDRPAPNPMAVLASCVTVTLAAKLVLLQTFKSAFAASLPSAGREPGVLGALLDTFGPSLHAIVLGVICHLTLWVLGKHRRSWRASVGWTIYCASAALVLLTVGLALTAAAVGASGEIASAARDGGVRAHLDATDMVGSSASLVAVVMLAVVFIIGSGLVMWVSIVRGLAAVHLARWYWVFLGLVIALLITGALFGLLEPPGTYGIHPVIDGGIVRVTI